MHRGIGKQQEDHSIWGANLEQMGESEANSVCPQQRHRLGKLLIHGQLEPSERPTRHGAFDNAL
jgi:hypothetical protein